MAVRIDTEHELVTRLFAGSRHVDFLERRLAPKVVRERSARVMLEQGQGTHTQQSLITLFDTLDHESPGGPWFGLLLGAANRALMFADGASHVNAMIRELLFSGHDFRDALDACSADLKISGVGMGLPSLLLYLADPMAYTLDEGEPACITSQSEG